MLSATDNAAYGKMCRENCWYLYPKTLTNREGYRCHCPGSCPAFCENCVYRKKCNKMDKLHWCLGFELDKGLFLSTAEEKQ